MVFFYYDVFAIHFLSNLTIYKTSVEMNPSLGYLPHFRFRAPPRGGGDFLGGSEMIFLRIPPDLRKSPPPIYFVCGSYNRKIFTCGAIKHNSVLLLLVPQAKFCDQRKSPMGDPKMILFRESPAPKIPQLGGGLSPSPGCKLKFTKYMLSAHASWIISFSS